MSNYFWLIDAGHGGINPQGEYTTAPVKMFTFPDGLRFMEGVNNRAIASRLMQRLKQFAIEFAAVHDAIEDRPLSERVRLANAIHATEKRCIYLSIHSDAMPEGAHGKGSGFAIYTSRGQTKSDAIADIFAEAYRSRMARFRFRADRSDGDDDREEGFYVLRRTHCPAILVENLFFDNRKEAEFLLSNSGQWQIADTLFYGIMTAERRRPV